MAYTRVHRLLKIITLIQSAPTWNARRLAEACETSERNIYRDLEMLQGAGVPVFYDDEACGYRIRREFFMSPVELTLDEALALVCLSEQIGAADQIPFMQPAARAVTKIRGQLPPSLSEALEDVAPHMDVRLAASMSAEGTADVYELVRQAIAQRRALRCTYESLRADRPDRVGDPLTADESSTGSQAPPPPEEQFLLKPYCLFFGQRAWYVVGHHSERQGLRCLKLNRFTQITPTDTPYAIPDDFSLTSYLGKAWRMIPGDRLYAVELHFDAAFAETIADTHWHATQDIEWLPDGSILFRCEVAGLDEIVWWILSMGPHCVVRRPKALADRVRKLAQAMASKYSRNRRLQQP